MPPRSSDATPDAVSFKVSRHDHHNLEVKLALAGDAREFQARSELFLFLPSTMRVSAYDKTDLMLDFTSRIRLSLPSEDRCAASLKRLCEDCQRLLMSGSPPPVEAIQNLGAIAGETLKTLRREHRKRL